MFYAQLSLTTYQKGRIAIPFDEKELAIVETIPGIPDFIAEFNYRNYPVSGKRALYDTFIAKKPHWVLSMNEYTLKSRKVVHREPPVQREKSDPRTAFWLIRGLTSTKIPS